MAFTAPVTRATDFLVTAAIWNAEHVDNFNTGVMHLLARKTASQSVTSSTAFVSDTDITFAVLANAIWEFEFRLRYDASATGDLKVSFSLPTSGEIDAFALTPSNATGAYQDASWQAVTTTDSQPLAFSGAGAGANRYLHIAGKYIGAGTAGNVTLRWAQNTSDATATRILAQSTAWGCQIA